MIRYFFSLLFLLWKTTFPTIIMHLNCLCRLLWFAAVEFYWNVYPSTSFPSLILLFLHLAILWGLYISPTEQPFIEKESCSSG
ncbi:hypothetical protein IEQ34_000224 [Dendrobium chrysotoxum]|uniref:Uncharacterized protein n=1 Tax=Dendrobium chrysotoxum TaxID=161865 RepID=A0AAV7HNI5_DENCH|nr:hypothetical protein IEQ34_000224 [Dendrobium chrysotoxum]